MRSWLQVIDPYVKIVFYYFTIIMQTGLSLANPPKSISTPNSNFERTQRVLSAIYIQPNRRRNVMQNARNDTDNASYVPLGANAK